MADTNAAQESEPAPFPNDAKYDPPAEVRPALDLMLRSGLYGKDGREIIRNLVHERIRQLALSGELARVEELVRGGDLRPRRIFDK